MLSIYKNLKIWFSYKILQGKFFIHIQDTITAKIFFYIAERYVIAIID